MENKKPTSEDMLNALAAVYDKTIDGIPHVSPPVEKMAKDYLEKYPNEEKAAKSMINYQIAKCTTSGFITGFGGFITMPVTIPANIGSVLYVQMRMIACAAYMGEYDINSDQVQTFIYACLAGVSVNGIVKKFGIELGKKLFLQGVKKIPGKVLTKINQKIGFRLVTKFGEKGLINIGKMVPVVGAVVSGGFDLVETKMIANRAYKMFIENNFDTGEDNVFDAEFYDEIDNDVDKPEKDIGENESNKQTESTNDEVSAESDDNSQKSTEEKSNVFNRFGSKIKDKAKSVPNFKKKNEKS